MASHFSIPIAMLWKGCWDDVSFLCSDHMGRKYFKRKIKKLEKENFTAKAC